MEAKDSNKILVLSRTLLLTTTKEKQTDDDTDALALTPAIKSCLGSPRVSGSKLNSGIIRNTHLH